MQTKRHRLVELIAGLVLPLGLLVLLDLLWLRFDGPVQLEFVAGLVWIVAAVVTPVVFWRFLRVAVASRQAPHRDAMVIGLTVVCTLVWYYVAFTLFVNIHLAMGGSL